MIKGMTVSTTPKPPDRHARKFTRDEVAAALSEFLTSRGVAVPEGEVRVFGLDDEFLQQSTLPHTDRTCLELVIEVSDAKQPPESI